MDMNRQEAITCTRATIEQATDSDALIITDGSYETTKGGGAAAILLNTNECILFRTGPDVPHSNHECEALGVLAALKLITTNAIQEKYSRFLVFTDNKGVLSRIKNPLAERPGQYLFSEMMKTVLDARLSSQILFIWYPGHVGIEGNERADEKASEAGVKGNAPPIKMLGNLTKIKKKILVERVTPDKTLNKKIPKVEISLSAILSQLASGECSLNGYLFQIRKGLDPSCPNCGYVKETVSHFFKFCPAYKACRRHLKKNLRQQRVAFNPNNLTSALKNLKAWPALTTFIKDSHRFQSLKPVLDLQPPPEPPETITESHTIS